MKYYNGKNLEGRVAIVTGASRGIGFAVSKIFSLNKIKVYMVSKNKERLNKAAKQLREEGGSIDFPVALPADVAEEQKVRNLFSDVMQKEGRVDILINNAAVADFKPFLETTLQDLRRVFQVNVEGVFLCSKEAFNIMKNQNEGYIVNVGSILSLIGYVNQSLYTASKHAILGLTKVLAQEGNKYNIRVISICPAGVRTDMAEELMNTIRPDLSLETLMDPEDVANTILYMIGFSEKAAIDNIVIRRKSRMPYF